MSVRFRLVALVMSASLALSVAAAGLAQEKVTLWIMTHSHGPFNTWISEKTDEYMRLNPNVAITYNHLPHAEFDQRIVVLLASGAAPDILNVYYPTMIDLIRGGFIAEAPPRVIEDLSENFIPKIIEGMTIDGRVYGYPTEAITLLPVVNEYLYEITGLDYPKSYRDLLDVQRKMSLYDSEGNVTRLGVTLSTGGLWLMLHWSAVLRAYGGRLVDENGHFAFDSPEGRLATEEYRELAPLIGKSFTEGQVGTVITGPYSRPGYKTANPDLRFRAIPALSGPGSGPIATSYFWGMVVNRASENLDSAWDFVQWLNSGENKRSLLESVNYPPVRYANINYYQEDEWFRTFAEQFAYAQTLPSMANWTEAQNTITEQISRFLNGEISVNEALANAVIGAEATIE